MKYIAAISAIAVLLAAAPARAENLPDPTRPPDVAGASAAGAGQAVNTGGLQTIIRGKHGKPAAIIDGEYVVLGGMVGDARLVKIGEDSVTLKSATGTETLKLMPGIEKTPARGGAEEKGPAARTPEKRVTK